MAWTRREVLKLGGLGTTAALVTSLRSPQSESVRERASSPFDQRYLLHGLDVLCHAFSTDSFFTGHAGGAILSAYFYCLEEQLEPGASDIIKQAVDQHYTLAPTPFPEEEPAKDGIAAILEAMEEGIDQLCRDGHNVIFLSLALKAMHALPQAVTPSRLRALERTVRSLEPKRSGKSGIEIPESTSAFSEFVLEEFLGCTEGGPGQGYAGHLLTYGRAIVDLRLMGHEAFAQKCLDAFALQVAVARPRSPGKSYEAERPEVEGFLPPHRKEYWRRRAASGEMELGHVFKYPYACYGLRRHSGNEKLNEVCLNNSYRLFWS